MVDSDDDEFDPPLFLTDLMREQDSEDEEKKEGSKETDQEFETRVHKVAGVEIKIREYAFSATNAGFVWPATKILGRYIAENIEEEELKQKRLIELGSGTGILSIFFKLKGLDITSSDVPDEEVTSNILHNQQLNGVEFKHIPHYWGEEFPKEENKFDVIIASDILLYVNQYPNLISTMKQLMRPQKENEDGKKTGTVMLMCYKRKIHGERAFFPLLEENGFSCEVLGHKLYRISRK